jgi:hypothetical protein
VPLTSREGDHSSLFLYDAGKHSLRYPGTDGLL